MVYLQAVQAGNHVGQGRDAPRIIALQVRLGQAAVNHVEELLIFWTTLNFLKQIGNLLNHIVSL